MQKAIFPVRDMRITQGYGNDTYSHGDSYAIDLGGIENVTLKAFAPFDCIIKKIYLEDANEVWIESLEKVIFADGTIDYMTVLFMHDNDVSDLYVGKVIKQYEEFYQEGTKGNTTGSHIHIECGKGKFQGSGWHQNQTGFYSIDNPYPPEKSFFITNNTNILNNGGYNFILETDVSRKYKVGDKLYLNGTLYLDSFGNNPNGAFVNELVEVTNVNFQENATKPYLLNDGKLGWVGEEQLSIEPISNETELDKLKKENILLQDNIILKDKQIQQLKEQIIEQNDYLTFNCTKDGKYYITLNKGETLYYKIKKEQV